MGNITLVSSRVRSAPRDPSLTHQSSPSEQILKTVGSATLVGIGYYVGTRIGFALAPIGQPNSAFWPPNAILLAAFLLAPRRIWWTLLLAALPAHLLAELQQGWPVWTTVALFFTNTSEAFIAAFLITRLVPPKRLFDSVRGILIFLVCGVLLAPFATSFPAAAVAVLTKWGRGYWPFSGERFLTNALAELTVVPMIVLSISNGNSWIRRATLARWWEAGLLAVGTALVTVVVFDFPSVSPATTPALLYAPLPFLLWATIRFGSFGLSSSLFCIALISISYTIHGREPFPYATVPQNILSLQILFFVVAVPLLFLSADMAEVQRTQESLRNMSVSLIEAQERERARIARELHDDISQRLAILAIELDQLQEDRAQVSPAIGARIGELRKQMQEVSEEIQALSHDLHSSKLEYLGVVAGIRSWCKEFAERQRIEIDFKADVSTGPPLDVGFCLLRVLQEALHNAVKHSGATRVDVELRENSDEIQLVVSDSGRGFDVETALGGKGLGLSSMGERVRLVNGTISIDSKPMSGTTIHVRVPVQVSSHL